MEIRVSFNGAAAAETELNALMERTRDMNGALQSIGRRLVKVTRDRFGSQTDPDGKPWTPLSALTVALRGGSRRPILTRSGRLQGSVIYQVSEPRLELGSNTIDANVHQYGAVIRPVKADDGKAEGFLRHRQVTIPARRFIGWGGKDQAAAKAGLEDWLAVEASDGDI